VHRLTARTSTRSIASPYHCQCKHERDRGSASGNEWSVLHVIEARRQAGRHYPVRVPTPTPVRLRVHSEPLHTRAHPVPRLRGNAATRFMFLASGLFLFAAGIVAMLESRLGLSPWDVFHQGIAGHTSLSFGQANVAVSILVVAVAWLLDAPIGIGTLVNAVLVGTFVQALTAPAWLSALANQALVTRVFVMLAGVLLIGAGTAVYLGAHLGAGPRDSLMVVGAMRTRLRIGFVRAALEASVLAAGFTLGGIVGPGTLLFVLAIGPVVELSFWAIARSPLARDAHVPDWSGSDLHPGKGGSSGQ
jgi:uncharacterized membrane protein YczE